MPQPPIQTRENHTRLHPPFHFFFVPAVALLAALSFRGLVRQPGVESAALCLLVVVVAVAGFLGRIYAMKVQDRVIRIEERQRLSALLPAELQHTIYELSERQLIALRFASNEELPALAERARAEHLEPKAIKALIQSWRPDHWRV